MTPTDIFSALRKDVIGQDRALQDMAVAIYKHLIEHSVGNVLLIGNSGTGKTTIMRAAERFFAQAEGFEQFSTIIRINANLVADLASRGAQSNVVMDRLARQAATLLGERADDIPGIRQRIREMGYLGWRVGWLEPACLDILGKAGKENVQGEEVEKLDEFKDRMTIVPGATNAPEVIEKAVAGCGPAYYLVHSMIAQKEKFVEADRAAARHMVAAAAAAGA